MRTNEQKLQNPLLYIFGFIGYQLKRFNNACMTSYNTSRIPGNHGVIGPDTILVHPERITLGERSYINGGEFRASENACIKIGSDTLISYHVHCRTDTHAHKSIATPIIDQGSVENDIVIGNDCWIGYGAQIMSGITIGNHAIVGAGAIVTHDVPEYAVVGGVPATIIGYRK